MIPVLVKRTAAAVLALAALICEARCAPGDLLDLDRLPKDTPMSLAEPQAYPTRSIFFGQSEPEPHPYCERPDPIYVHGDYTFFQALAQVAVGDEAPVGEFPHLRAENWENMGFERVYGEWRRRAFLDGHETLATTNAPQMKGIDAIAISTIDRHNGQHPYIYSTLHSLFKVLPEGVPVNLMVGNADAAYLGEEVLRAQGLSGAQIARLVIFPARPDVHAFLGEVFADSVRRKSAWNYARTLRSYQGTQALLFLEDDIEWADFALQHFLSEHAKDPLPIVSLFNRRCGKLKQKTCEKIAAGDQRLVIDQPIMRRVHFNFTQAVLYSRDVTMEMGRYLQPRMHEAGYDEVLNRFVHRHGLHVGYAYPSLVQHTGRATTTGVSNWFPLSDCFVKNLPACRWALPAYEGERTP